MLKIVRNHGQSGVEELENCRYLFYTDEFSVGRLYSKVRPQPLFWYMVAKIRGKKDRP